MYRVDLDPKALIDNSPELGSPPVVYARLMKVIDDPNTGAQEVADVISLDAALTVRLLRLVNSAAFARRRQIDTVGQAVALIGTTGLRDLALATSVTTFFKDVPAELIHADDFWRHSLATGVAAKVIAGIRKERNADRFFVAGLLHDIGRLVLYVGAPAEARTILDHAIQEQEPIFEIERQLMGFDHGTIGGALMTHWNMPDALAESITHHHSPMVTKAFAVEAATVHLADALAHELQLGRSGESLVPERQEGAMERLGIDPAVLDDALKTLEEQYVDTVAAFGLA